LALKPQLSPVHLKLVLIWTSWKSLTALEPLAGCSNDETVVEQGGQPSLFEVAYFGDKDESKVDDRRPQASIEVMSRPLQNIVQGLLHHASVHRIRYLASFVQEQVAAFLFSNCYVNRQMARNKG
jgi:hypothetical protein